MAEMAIDNMTEELKVVASREHIDLQIRAEQILTNLLGWKGGRPYIDARLSRFPAESNLDWEGGTRDIDGSYINGRKDQAHCVNHLSRVVNKIDQYVLGVSPIRKDIDENIKQNITIDGQSIDRFMKTVSSLVTVEQWCWIGIDAPSIDPNAQISLTEKEAMNIRPYWKLYNALEVVDWFYNDLGELEWLITETMEYQGSDPFVAPLMVKVRRLWQKGMITKYTFDPDNQDKIVKVEEIMLSYKTRVPFVLVNETSSEPWGFDSIESINRTLLDLGSCNRQNFFNSVFCQMYMPASVLDNVMSKFDCNAESAVTKIMGYSMPILLDTDDVVPGQIMPDASSIGTIRTEINDLTKELYNSVGLMLQNESRMVASADAKRFDHLDITQVMKERAQILEDAEKQAIKISNEWDSDFKVWEPVYNRDFDVSDFKKDIESLIMTSNVSMPKEMNQYILKQIFNRIKQETSVTEEEEQIVLDAIKAFDAGSMELIDIPSFGDNNV